MDAIAGAEALISHVVTQRLGVPCAHAPAFALTDGSDPSALAAAPKAAAEELGHTFLPCVLAYLHRAPSLVPLPCASTARSGGGSGGALLTSDDVDAVVVPHSALGGPAVLSLLARHLVFPAAGAGGAPTRRPGARPVLVVPVLDNTSSMQVGAEDLLPSGAPSPAIPRAAAPFDEPMDTCLVCPHVPGAASLPGVTVVPARSYAEVCRDYRASSARRTCAVLLPLTLPCTFSVP